MKHTKKPKQVRKVREAGSDSAKSMVGVIDAAKRRGFTPKPKTHKGPLSPGEKKAFAASEEVIKQHLPGGWDLAEALTTISKNHLYRDEYSSFKEYCPKRWRLSHCRARQLINALVVREHLGKACGKDMLPETECQVRPLTHLRENLDLQVQAWESAWSTAKGQPTGIQVKEAVEALSPRTPRSRDAKVAGLLRGLTTLSKDAPAVNPAVAVLLENALKLLAEPQKPQEDNPSKSRRAKA